MFTKLTINSVFHWGKVALLCGGVSTQNTTYSQNLLQLDCKYLLQTAAQYTRLQPKSKYSYQVSDIWIFPFVNDSGSPSPPLELLTQSININIPFQRRKDANYTSVQQSSGSLLWGNWTKQGPTSGLIYSLNMSIEIGGGLRQGRIWL